MAEEFTEDMMRLLYVIHAYTDSDDEENPTWVKELPLMAIIYEGIVRGIFVDYDYAPWSVSMLDGTREWLNISREGKDDLEDLLNLRYISIIRVSTSQYGFVTAYRLTELGAKVLLSVPDKIREEVKPLIYHECGELLDVVVRNRNLVFVCSRCGFEEVIPIGDIEDVPYATKAYLPSFNFGWFGAEHKE